MPTPIVGRFEWGRNGTAKYYQLSFLKSPGLVSPSAANSFGLSFAHLVYVFDAVGIWYNSR